MYERAIWPLKPRLYVYCAIVFVRLRKSTPKMAYLPLLHLNADNMLTMAPHSKML